MGWVVNATPRPLYPRKRPDTHCIWPQGRSRQVRQISPPPGFDPRADQPVASRYTDYAIRPTSVTWTAQKWGLCPKKKMNVEWSDITGHTWKMKISTPRNCWQCKSSKNPYKYWHFPVSYRGYNNKENWILSHYFIWHLDDYFCRYSNSPRVATHAIYTYFNAPQLILVSSSPYSPCWEVLVVYCS
jgi:hypothetical protein